MNKNELTKTISNAKQESLKVFHSVETIRNTDKVLKEIRHRVLNAKQPIMIVLIEL